MGFEISLFKFPKNSPSEWLLEGKAVTLRDEFKEHKAVSQKASFQFLSEVFHFHLDLHGLPNITFKFHRNSLSERFLEGKAVTLWNEFTDHKVVSQKSSFSFWWVDVSFGPIVFQGIRNISSQNPQKLSQRTAPQNTAVTLWVGVTHHKAVSQKACFQFSCEDIFFFTIGHYGLPNIPLQTQPKQS